MRPRLRFSLRALLVLPAVGACIAFAAIRMAPMARVSGTIKVPLSIEVVEALAGEPIVGASVRIVDPDPSAEVREPGSGAVEGASGVGGQARLIVPVPYQGSRSRFREVGTMDFGHRWLMVSAPGHAGRVVALSDYTGESRAMGDLPPALKVAMHRGETPDPGLGAFVGKYDDLYRNLEISADGRYFATHSQEHGYDKGYGLARVEGGCLILNPSDRGPEARRSERGFRLAAGRYHRVAWGDRAYLIEDGEILRFCNSINLRGTDGITRYDNNYYMREGDREKPIAGFPRVPGRWTPYLLKKPLEGEVVEILEDGSARVNLGSRDGVLVGMQLTLAWEYCGLDVTSVGETSCIVRYAEPYACKDGLAKGARLSTRIRHASAPDRE